MVVGLIPKAASEPTNQTIDSIVRQVEGNLTYEDCATLWEIVEELPSEAIILDINAGGGRSTVLLSKALQGSPATILSLTDNKSFNGHTHHRSSFGCGSEVVPILAGIDHLKPVLNKRSANLIVLQLPPHNDDNLSTIERLAPFLSATVRSGGSIVVICPTGGFIDFLAEQLSKDITLSHRTDRLAVFVYEKEEKREKKSTKRVKED